MNGVLLKLLETFLAQFTGSFIGVILCGREIPVRGFRFCFVTGFVLIGLGASCLVLGTWIVGLLSVFAYGVGIGFSAGTTNLWVSEVNPSRRASALSLVNCSWTLGAIASPLLVAVGDQIRQITLFVAVFAILEELNELKCGCHAFHRFRITHLWKKGVPEDLIHFWLRQAGKSVTEHCSKLKDDPEFRKEVAVRVGLGFELPSKNAEVGPNGPEIETEALQEMAASV